MEDLEMSSIFEYKGKKVYPIIYPERYGQMTNINCYLYESQNRLTLIDAGIDSVEYETFFYKKLAEYGFDLTDIDQIILTHHHTDHIGMVNKIIETKKMPVFAHPSAIERLALTEQYQHTKIQFFEELYTYYGCEDLMKTRIEKMYKTLYNDEGLRIQTFVQPIQAQDFIGDLLVLETPGHSLDSISLYDQQTDWLFTGDLIIEKGTTNALIDFDANKSLLPTVWQQRKSIEQCLNLHVSTVFAGHEAIFDNFEEVAQANLAKMDYKVQRIVKQVEQGNDTILKIANAIYGQLMYQIPTLIFSEVIGYVKYAEKLERIDNVKKNKQVIFRVLI